MNIGQVAQMMEQAPALMIAGKELFAAASEFAKAADTVVVTAHALRNPTVPEGSNAVSFAKIQGENLMRHWQAVDAMEVANGIFKSKMNAMPKLPEGLA